MALSLTQNIEVLQQLDRQEHKLNLFAFLSKRSIAAN